MVRTFTGLKALELCDIKYSEGLRVYKHEIQNIETLKQKIQEECMSFTEDELKNIYENMEKRALLCAENHGHHIEHLL